MAVIKITIEDKPDGNVKILCDPKASHLAMKTKSAGAEELTSAEGYALFAINQLMFVSSKQGPKKTPLWLPKIIRP